MLELNPYRKNKINLADYDYVKDIENRRLLASLTTDEMAVLEEILYSPPKVSLEALKNSLDVDVEPALEKLLPSNLFTIEEGTLFINKEMRKYFEAQAEKFEDDFTPGMEFLQTLLKKVPIHVLPNWYPIPRSSDNIFDAIVEKYLETPQTYQRYLNELGFGDETLSSIMKDLFEAPEYYLLAKDVMAKYGLDQNTFEEIMLILEFNFVCCISHMEKDGVWMQVVTPFHEWREYLRHLRVSQPKKLEGDVKRYRPHDFAFVDDLTALLELADDEPVTLVRDANERWTLDSSEMTRVIQAIDLPSDQNSTIYVNELVEKLLFFRLGVVEKSQLKQASDTGDWLNMSIERRGLALYKHSTANIDSNHFDESLATERNLKEIEKSLESVADLGWVCFDDFLASLTISLSDQSRVALQKVGRNWRYTIPTYSDAEKELIQKTIMGWFFEAGVTAIGSCSGKSCFMVTGLGRKLFSQET